MGAQELSALKEQLELGGKWAQYNRPAQWEGPVAEVFSAEMEECAILFQRAIQAANSAQETARMLAVHLQEVVQAMGAGRLQEWVA